MTNTQNLLTVCEDGQPISFSHDDLTRYHGFGYPGGVAHAFKVMQFVLPKLNGGNPPERRKIHIRTPFKGPGGRDAFELVTRCVTDGRYLINPELMRPERGEILKGYVFIFDYDEKTFDVQIRPGHVREDFIALSRKPNKTDAEEKELAALKIEMAQRLVPLPADEVYELV